MSGELICIIDVCQLADLLHGIATNGMHLVAGGHRKSSRDVFSLPEESDLRGFSLPHAFGCGLSTLQ